MSMTKTIKTIWNLSIGDVQFKQLTKKEMFNNVLHLSLDERAISVFKLAYNTSVESLCASVCNAMFERFVSEIVTDSVLCGISAPNARQFAVDFIQNNDYAKMCLNATINLVLDGTISKKQQLDDFIAKLLWSHVVEACHEKLNGNK